MRKQEAPWLSHACLPPEKVVPSLAPFSHLKYRDALSRSDIYNIFSHAEPYSVVKNTWLSLMTYIENALTLQALIMQI